MKGDRAAKRVYVVLRICRTGLGRKDARAREKIPVMRAMATYLPAV